jgi:hypothetical protein
MEYETKPEELSTKVEIDDSALADTPLEIDTDLTFDDAPEETNQEEVDYAAEAKRLAAEKLALEAKVKELTPKEPEVKVPDKPTLESCDFDAEEYEKKYDEWHQTKLKADSFGQKAKAKQEKQEKDWQTRVDGYVAAKKAFPKPDYVEAETLVQNTLTPAQQTILVARSCNPTQLVYALSKSKNKLKELAETDDLIAFAYEIAHLDSQMKTKSQPKPEAKAITGRTPTLGNDASLNRLRAEAEKTGDYSKVVQYKKKQRSK